MSQAPKPDPRVVFLLVFSLSGFAVLIRQDVVAVFALLLLSIFFAWLMGVKLGRLYSRLRLLFRIMLMVALLRSLFAPSGVWLLAVGNLPLVTTGGLASGFLVAFRFVVFIAGASMFTIYKPRALIQAMVQMKLPYEIAYMVSIGARFVPLLAEQLKDSLVALQLRGIVVEELRFRKRLSLYTYLLLPALVSALQQAKELSMSMEMRAFRAMKERTSYYRLSLKPSDIAMMLGVLALVFAIGFVVFRYNFYLMLYDLAGVTE